MPDINFLILAYLVAANILSFALVGLDKGKSINNSLNRIPEVYLFFCALFLSSLGILLGMLTFRHKTRKLYFMVGISILLLQQTLLIIYVLRAINAS